MLPSPSTLSTAICRTPASSSSSGPPFLAATSPARCLRSVPTRIALGREIVSLGNVVQCGFSLVYTDVAPMSATVSTWSLVALQTVLTLCIRWSPPTRLLSFLITSPSLTASSCPSPSRRPLARCPSRSLARACLTSSPQLSVFPIPLYRSLHRLPTRPSSCTALPLLSAP